MSAEASNTAAVATLEPWSVEDRIQILDVPPWFTVWADRVRLPDGRVVDPFYTIDQPDHAVIVAITGTNQVIGLWSYKHGAKAVRFGLPAGHVEAGEDPLSAAKRELLEETGYTAQSWHHVGSFAVDGNRGFGNAHLFRAERLDRAAEPTSDDLEEQQVVLCTAQSLREHLAAGQIASLTHATGILYAVDWLDSSPGSSNRQGT